eukprot:CFRG3883T1
MSHQNDNTPQKPPKSPKSPLKPPKSPKSPLVEVKVPTIIGIEVYNATNIPLGTGTVRMRIKSKSSKVRLDCEVPEDNADATIAIWNSVCNIESDGKSAITMGIMRNKRLIDKLVVPLKILKETKLKKIWRFENGTKMLASIWIGNSKSLRLEKVRSKSLVHRALDGSCYELSDEDIFEEIASGLPPRKEILNDAFDAAIKYANEL